MKYIYKTEFSNSSQGGGIEFKLKKYLKEQQIFRDIKDKGKGVCVPYKQLLEKKQVTNSGL